MTAQRAIRCRGMLGLATLLALCAPACRASLAGHGAEPSSAAPIDSRVQVAVLEASNPAPGLVLGSVLRGDGLELTFDRVETRRVLPASIALVDEIARDVLVRSVLGPKGAPLPLPWARHDAVASATSSPPRAHVYLFARVRNVAAVARQLPFVAGAEASSVNAARAVQLELGAASRLVGVLPEVTDVLLTGDEACAGTADGQPLAPGETRGLVLLIETGFERARARNQRLRVRFAGETNAYEVLLRTETEHKSMLATEQVVLPLLAALHAGSRDRACQLLADGVSCELVEGWTTEYRALEGRLGRHALTIDHRLTTKTRDGALELRLAVTSPCELRAEGYADCLRSARLSSRAQPLTLRVRTQGSGLRLQAAQLALETAKREELEREQKVAERFGPDCWITPLPCMGDVVECLRDDGGVSIVLDDSGTELCRTSFDLRRQGLDVSAGDPSAPSSMCPPRELWSCFADYSPKAAELLHRRAFSQLFAPRCGGRLARVHECFASWALNPHRRAAPAPDDECRLWDFEGPGRDVDALQPDGASMLNETSVIPFYELGQWLAISQHTRARASAQSAMLWIHSEPWASVSIGRPLEEREISPDRLVAESTPVGLTPLLYTGLRLPAGTHSVTLRTADGRTSTRDVELHGGNLTLLYARIGRGEHSRSWMMLPDGTRQERTWELLPDGRMRETTP